MGYGNYGYNLYTSKKGKNWYSNNICSKYGTDNTRFSFPKDKAMLLEDIESSNEIRYGLQPYAPIPKKARYSDNTKLYFAIEDEKILLESLINLMNNIPFIPHDRIVFKNINPIITGYDCYNNPIYDNIIMDVKNAIMNTDSLTRGYLNNTIIAFCFEYVLPQAAYDISIYDNSINDIMNSIGFKDRIMLIRTDIINNRILFIVSNIIEDSQVIDKYIDNYNAFNSHKRKYKGSDILFSKRADTMYNILDNKLCDTLQEYSKNVKIFISKSIK